MWIAGNKEREDISQCFIFFPQFHTDYPALLNEGVIKRIAFDQYEWTKSKTSLAEYFNWVGKFPIRQVDIKGGFWTPIEKVFLIKGEPIKRRSLSHLASGNGNDIKPEKSRDFLKIKEIVEKYRENIKRQTEQEQKDMGAFFAIKILIDKTDGKNINKIRETLEKIKTVLL
jgi:hypothetical protein